MEIFGGLMVMLLILGFCLAVIWLVLPIVVFGIKVKVDSMLCLLEDMDKRLQTLEKALRADAAALPESSEEAVPPLS